MLSVGLGASLDEILQIVMNHSESDGFSRVHSACAADFNDGIDLLPPGQRDAIQNGLPGGGGDPSVFREGNAGGVQRSGQPVIDAIFLDGASAIYQKDLPAPAKLRDGK